MSYILGLSTKVKRKIVKFTVGFYIAFTIIWQLIEPINSFLPNAKIDGPLKFFFMILVCLGLATMIARPMREVELMINNTKVKITYGDLFKTTGYKVIPVNEYFDSEIGLPVSPNSLHGKFIENVLGGQASCFDNLIENSLKDTKFKHVIREKGGNSKKYEIGTTAVVDCNSIKFFLVALSKTDIKTFKASASKLDYMKALTGLWNTVRVYANGYNVNVPLIGGGLSGVDLSPQRLLEYLLTSISMQDELIATSITIVLHKDIEDSIDLDLVRQMWITM